MSPREFYSLVVQPNIAEMQENYGDIRRAFNAIAAIDSLAAHVHWAVQGADSSATFDDNAYREQLARRHDDFRLLRDVAKASKHVLLTRGKPEVSGAGQVAKRSLGWGEARWGEGRWGGVEQVVIMTNAGDSRVVETVVNNALTFLLSEMDQHGL